ncbi:hypothetical protein DFR86_03925 [Acidianus sulfidivorans JP7]|uniref:Uncharacterized protein n=1 Tax=Acidianus sulfidivorans JP7 TaxID=619593 RepID=A0A2U9IQF9_9CREN|nr:hypothetical protein [Acidianus sulfidivorans]AWR98223.1 hypothetical protein DFR86_03925 [Acidianus sulfidivorans JP7]
MLRKKIIIPLLFVISVIAYFEDLGKTMPELLYLSAISAGSFWAGIALLIPVKFYKYILPEAKKSKAYWISAISYLTFHLLAYGIFYVMILGYIGFYVYFGFGIGATTTPPWPYFLYWETTSPGFWFLIGPYESDGTPFAVFIGIILALLIGANVEKIVKMYKLLKSSKNLPLAIVSVPTIGIISGTSCCLSLPTILIYMTALAVGAVYSVLGILASPVYFALAYYGLPIGSVFLLYFNLRDMNRIISKCKYIKMADKINQKSK